MFHDDQDHQLEVFWVDLNSKHWVTNLNVHIITTYSPPFTTSSLFSNPHLWHQSESEHFHYHNSDVLDEEGGEKPQFGHQMPQIG